VYLEITGRRTFAMALDWPGWGRAGKTADAALAALAAYAPRFAPVAAKAGLKFSNGRAIRSDGRRGAGRKQDHRVRGVPDDGTYSKAERRDQAEIEHGADGGPPGRLVGQKQRRVAIGGGFSG
jgi:hypothetical protein